MNRLEEMKKDNKGFSLVELIVVIAIMVVLIAVLGSTILGYVEKSKYSKDMQALDSVDTAIMAFVADANSVMPSDASTGTTLKDLMDVDTKNIIAPILAETFGSDNIFNSTSSAFDGITTENVDVWIVNGAVAIRVESKDPNYDDYEAGNVPS